jgi:hypothetical protein
MADVVTKSVRLMDKEVRLYPRVKLEDIVKSVAADGTETVAKLVEQNTTSSNIVYGTSKVTNGDTIIQALLPYSEAANGGTIAKRDNSGRLDVADPTETIQAVNMGYANTHYGRLSSGNDWTNLNRFNTESISVHATDKSIYMKLTNQGFVVKTSPSSEEHNITLQDANGTIAYLGDVSSTATSTLASAKSYTDTQINAKLSSALKYKGSKDTYADLPKTGNQVGDVWNVVAAYGNAHAGTNWAWNGTVWDPLGGTIDLTNYAIMANAATTSTGIVTAPAITGSRQIVVSTYTISPSLPLSSSTTIVPTSNVIKTYVDNKLSGSIWDSTKVVYAKTSDTNTSWAVTTPHILVSETDDSGHILAREGYMIDNENLSMTNDHIPTSKVVSDAIDGPIGVLRNSKLDKKTTAGTFAYAHVGDAQTEFLVTPETAVSSIVYRDSAGRTKAIGPIATLSTATATNVGVVISDADSDYVTTGSILQSLVTRINSSLGLINNSLITYEEVSA